MSGGGAPVPEGAPGWPAEGAPGWLAEGGPGRPAGDTPGRPAGDAPGRPAGDTPGRPPVVDMHVHPYTGGAIRGYGEPFRRCAEAFRAIPSAQFGGDTSSPIPIGDTVTHMRSAGVGMAVVLNVDAHTRLRTRYRNEALAEEVALHGDFLRFFAAVDPRVGRRRAVRELRRALSLPGCIGLKLHPPYIELFPDDRRLLYPLYEVCAGLGRPVLFHTGSTLLPGTKIKFGRPALLDDVATDFPGLGVIMSHFGWPWVDEALAVVWRHERVYLDVSGHLPRHVPPAVWHYAQVPGLSGRFLFGSDYPFFRPDVMVEAYRGFKQWFCPMCNRVEMWKPGVKEAMMGENFLRMAGVVK